MGVDEEAAEPVGRITLIGTIHNPLGHCTVEALHGLLERLAPEVIFEEWRPCDVAARDADLRWQSLDRRAITRYVEGKTVQQVPVEDYELPADFGADANRLLEYVNRHSPEYRALQRVVDEEAYQYGFAYLNSPSCAALHRRQQALMEHTVALSGDAALQQILNTWTALMRQREMAMVDTIYAFARAQSFIAGVFLVGAAHTSAIGELIAARPVADQALIAWEFGSGQ